MTPDLALRLFIDPALRWLVELGIPSDDRARAMLVAVALLESGLKHRDQIDAARANGPALGFWQFEMNGGCADVLEGKRTKPIAGTVLSTLGLPSDAPVTRRNVWEMLEFNDVLAAAFARLLLWPDPEPLPKLDEPDKAWRYYLRIWRPGKPRPNDWPKCWDAAVRAVRAVPFDPRPFGPDPAAQAAPQQERNWLSWLPW